MYPCFHKNLGPYSLVFLSNFLNCNITNTSFSMSEKIDNFSGVDKCSFNDIVFLNDNVLASNKIIAKAILISKKNRSKPIKNKIFFIVEDLSLAISNLSNLFYSKFSNIEIDKLNQPKIAKPKNLISSDAIISNGCKIGSNFKRLITALDMSFGLA